jgi:hypothetical protein
MLKLSLALLLLAGTCTAQEPSLSQLQGSARILVVFAPDAHNQDFNRQLQLIERHSFELSLRNTVVVPISSSMDTAAHFSFENLPLISSAEQADLRDRFHVQSGDFLVVLLNEEGNVQIRSASPVDIHELTASLDAAPLH